MGVRLGRREEFFLKNEALYAPRSYRMFGRGRETKERKGLERKESKLKCRTLGK